MEQTTNLAMPLIAPAQAQKHVTHNEALLVLDALAQLALKDRDLAAPPASPQEGDRYLVAAGASGDWTGKTGLIAVFQAGGWVFHAPKAGWRAWVDDEGKLIAFDGAAWVEAGGGAAGSVNPTALVGVNATADAGNRLTVSSAAALFTHEGDDHRLKINKAAAADTASLVFQTGFSGRAEFGLAGEEDFSIKVSADGLAWKEALRVDRTTGRVETPFTPAAGVEAAPLCQFPGKLARIAAGEAQIANVVMIGDSWVGQGNISGPVRAELQGVYGDAGWGYVGFLPNLVVPPLDGSVTTTLSPTIGAVGSSPNWATDAGPPSDFPGPDTGSVTSSQAGDTITATAANASGFRLHFFKKSGGGTFSYAVNGGAAVNVDTSNASTAHTVVTVTGLTAGAQSVVITVVSGSVTLCGIEWTRATPGVRVHQVGASGSNTGVWERADATLWQASIAALNPDLVTITLGVNDHASQASTTPPAVTAANLTTIINRIKAAAPLADIVILPQTDVSRTPPESYPITVSEYARQERAVALATGAGFIPVMDAFGTWDQSNSRGLMLDALHPNAAGGRMIAEMLLTAVAQMDLTPQQQLIRLLSSLFAPQRPPKVTGDFNTTFGIGAGQALTSGQYNLLFGSSAGKALTSGQHNLAMGNRALEALTTATGNVAVGSNALLVSTADLNTAVGYQALTANTTGRYQVAIGADALVAHISGDNNVAIGASAGAADQTGVNNTYVGRYSGYSNVSAAGNTFVGASAGFAATGANNTCFGYLAGAGITTGVSNCFVGRTAGDACTTGQQNTTIGANTDVAPTLNNQTAIGFGAVAILANTCVIGGTGASAQKVGVQGVQDPTAGIDIGGDTLRVRTPKTIVNSTDPGAQGDHCWDVNYFYLCVGTNSWKRAELKSW